MFLRNLMAMDTEEMIRGQPMDAVVLVGGCDKTVPAQIMAAASVDLPAIVLPVGPAATGNHKGEVLGACTDCRRLWGRYRAGEIDRSEIDEVNGRLVGSVGTCTVMGTASTMACLAEALGLALPNAGSAPATAAERMRLAEATGKQAVALAAAGRRGRARSSPTPRCGTPWSSCRRSADRPTGSSTSPPSPAAPAAASTSTSSTGSAARCRCWST